MSGYHFWRMGEHWGFWFRVLGYGLAVSTTPPLFSQRMGITPCYRIGRMKIEPLRPDGGC